MIITLLSLALTARADVRLAFDRHVFAGASTAEFEAFRTDYDLEVREKFPATKHWLVFPAALDRVYEPLLSKVVPPTPVELAAGAWTRGPVTAGRLVVPFILPGADAERLHIPAVPITRADLVLRSYDEELARVAMPDAEAVLREVQVDRHVRPPRLVLSEGLRYDLGRIARGHADRIEDEVTLELEIVDPKTGAVVRAPLYVWNLRRAVHDFDRTFFMRKRSLVDRTYLKQHCARILSRIEAL